MIFKKHIPYKDKKIEFHLANDFRENYGDCIPVPGKASTFLPDWFREIERGDGYKDTMTIKACIPFRDIMTSGYIIPHWQDVGIMGIDKEENVIFRSSIQTYGVSSHPSHQVRGCPLDRLAVLKFNSPWIIKTPPGYSCLFIQPFAHEGNSAITYVPSIVDTDKYFNQINFPFFYNPSEEQTYIKRYSPMIQVIPFKRESWVSSVITNMSKKKIHEWKTNRYMISTMFEKGYLKNFWTRKKYK